MAVLCDAPTREPIGLEPCEDRDKRKGRVAHRLSSYGYEGGKYQDQAGLTLLDASPGHR
ncbi:MAG: hypothetical protein ACYTGF_13060 [Planctomycetota bacterium]|jgi:hypothetical protein